MLQKGNGSFALARDYLDDGDWKGLASLSKTDFEFHEGQSDLTLLSALGLFQTGDFLEAKTMVERALSQGKRNAEIASLLIFGVLNSLARARVALGEGERAQPLFDASTSTIRKCLNDATINNGAVEQTRQVREALYAAETLKEVRHRKSLRQIYAGRRTKVSDKWSFYLNLYDEIFARYRDHEICLLEIGIQNGGSLEAWNQYFSNAKTIIGCDINPKCKNLKFSEKNISIVVADASSDATKTEIQRISDNDQFDIIIDDGSHVSSDCIANFFLYFPILGYSGTYVVEDVHCSYWQDFEGGLFHPKSTMAFFKKIADLVNGEHWNNNLDFSEYLYEFGLEGHDLNCLNEVYSVSFYNSVIVLEKRTKSFCALGRRVLVGKDAAVTGVGVLNENGRCMKVRDQSANPYAQISFQRKPIG